MEFIGVGNRGTQMMIMFVGNEDEALLKNKLKESGLL
jgi:hypothetical protein